MECLPESHRPAGVHNLVLGAMVCFHVPDELYGETGRRDASSLDPLGCLAGNYTKVETIFELPMQDL